MRIRSPASALEVNPKHRINFQLNAKNAARGRGAIEKFEPDHLMQLYKKVGAQYFCSMVAHHRGFDLWKSTHQPRWNAVAGGPEKNIFGILRRAAAKVGLRFAVSEHLALSDPWFSLRRMTDKTGAISCTCRFHRPRSQVMLICLLLFWPDIRA